MSPVVTPLCKFRLFFRDFQGRGPVARPAHSREAVRMLLGISLCFAAASGFAPTPLPRWPPSVAVASVPFSSPRFPVAHMAADEKAATPPEGGIQQLSLLLPFLALVSVKTATDLVTNHVVRPPATAMALVAELSIFPLIVLWLAVGNGLKLLRRLGSSDDSASTPLRNIPAVFTDAAAERYVK